MWDPVRLPILPRSHAAHPTPVVLKLPSGYIQPSPWLGIANKQLELMAKYMAELGLSPVSRSRVQAKPPYRKKPWEFGGEWVDPRSKFDGLRGPWCRENPDEFFG